MRFEDGTPVRAASGRGAVRRRLAGGPGRRDPRLRLAGRRRAAGCGSSRRSAATTCSTRPPAPRSSSRTSRRSSRSPTAGPWPSARARPPRGCAASCSPRPRSWSPGWPRSTPRSPSSLEVAPDQLNLEGAAVVGDVAAVVPARAAVRRRAERQRRRRARRASSTSRPGAPAAVRVSGVRRYDLGTVAGVGLAVTDAVSLSERPGAGQRGRRGLAVDVRRRPGGRLGPRPARRRPAARPGRAPAAGRRGGQGRGAGPGRASATTCSTWSRSSTPTTRRCRRCCSSWRSLSRSQSADDAAHAEDRTGCSASDPTGLRGCRGAFW